MGRPASLPKGKRPRPAGHQSFRFPCGHVESGDSIDRRTRATEHAAWVRCRACNVIGLLVNAHGPYQSRRIVEAP